MEERCISLLSKRGVEVEDIVNCVLFLQKTYQGEGVYEDALSAVKAVLRKREVQHAILTGVELDMVAEKGLLNDSELSSLILEDASLYGIDEVLAYGICNLYGSIALTNYGYIDREKPGIIGKLNKEQLGVCNTFIDDIVGAIAASAASALAHGRKRKEYEKSLY